MKNINFKLIALLILLSISASAYFASQSQLIALSFSINTESPTTLQIYYDLGSGFNEENSIKKYLSGSKESEISLRLPANIKGLRIDPATSPMRITLGEIYINRSIDRKKSPIKLHCFTHFNGAKIIGAYIEKNITIDSLNSDPYVIINSECIPDKNGYVKIYTYVIPCLVILLILFYFFKKIKKNNSNVGNIALVTIVTFATILIFYMALKTPFNMHPDENGHVPASQFYEENWLKKRVDHPQMVNSLVPNWGTSYLYINDSIYMVAEKLTSPLKSLGMDDYKRYRIFNSTLFVVLAIILAFNWSKSIWFFLVLGISPQTLYIFSYFNGDAFSLFWGLISGIIFVVNLNKIIEYFWKGGGINRYLIYFCLSLIMITFTRANYLILIPYFLGMLIILKPIDMPLKNNFIKTSIRCSIFLFIIFIPFFIEKLYIYYINDFIFNDLVQLQRQLFATPELLLSNIIETKNNPHLLSLRDFGVPLKDLLSNEPSYSGSFISPSPVTYSWLLSTWLWFFGVYGYGVYMTTFSYVVTNTLLPLTLMGSVLFLKFKEFKPPYALISAFNFFFILLVICQSLMFSWTYSFQPQGRYVMPLLPMLAIWLSLGPKVKIHTSQILFMEIIFLFSCISFYLYAIIPMAL